MVEPTDAARARAWEAQNLARSIRQLRESRGLSQEDLATRLREAGLESTNQVTVSRVENGSRDVRYPELRALADIFGVTLERLSGRDDPIADQARQMVSLIVDVRRARDDALETLRTLGSALEDAAIAIATYDMSEGKEETDPKQVQAADHARDALARAADDDQYASLIPAAITEGRAASRSGLDSLIAAISSARPVDADA